MAFFLAAVGLMACDDSSTGPDETEQLSLTTAWQQGFETGTVGWIGSETSGPEGWCGTIQWQRTGGPVAPSRGSAYALVEHGACNDFWTDNGFPNGSGPFGPFGGYGADCCEPPMGGFVTELDIYLDPSWEAGPDGSVFTYAVSFTVLDEAFPTNFRYFFLPVTKEDGDLRVAGSTVSEAGWYTFLQSFGEDGGSLAVDFELVRGGETVASQRLTQTAFSEEETSSFALSNVGTGYSWFVAIREALSVPIDEHELLYRQ